MEVIECRYRGRVIGWLVEGPDGFLAYKKKVLRRLRNKSYQDEYPST